MTAALRGLHRFVALLLHPLDWIPVSWGLVLISILTGVLMLLLFRMTSNQARIREVRERIKAHILEIRLFRDSPAVILRALGQILKKNTLYLRYALVPLIVIVVPLFLLLLHLNVRYSYRAPGLGESIVVSAEMAQGVDLREVTLRPPAGLEQETPPLRLPAEALIYWRLRVVDPGAYGLGFFYNGQVERKQLIAQPHAGTLPPVRTSHRPLPVLLHPGEPPLPPGSPFQSLRVGYPARVNPIFGLKPHWLISYFVISLLAAIILKGPLKVEI